MESDNPNIQWALKLLTPDPTYEPNIFSKYFAQIPCLIIVPLTCRYINISKGRPGFSRELSIFICICNIYKQISIILL